MSETNGQQTRSVAEFAYDWNWARPLQDYLTGQEWRISAGAVVHALTGERLKLVETCPPPPSQFGQAGAVAFRC